MVQAYGRTRHGTRSPGHRVIFLTQCETRVIPVFEKCRKMQNVHLECWNDKSHCQVSVVGLKSLDVSPSNELLLLHMIIKWKLFREILDIDGSEIFGLVLLFKMSIVHCVQKVRSSWQSDWLRNQESVGTHETLQSSCYWQHVWYCKKLFLVKCRRRSPHGQFCQSRRSKVSWLSCTPLHKLTFAVHYRTGSPGHWIPRLLGHKMWPGSMSWSYRTWYDHGEPWLIHGLTTMVEPWLNYARFCRGTPIPVNLDNSPEVDKWLSRNESRINNHLFRYNTKRRITEILFEEHSGLQQS